MRKFLEVDPALEFRAFVSHNQGTALSQYESGLYFPELVGRKAEIERRIKNFWEEIKDDILDEIGLDSYVIDFAFLRNDSIVIVELNPFHAHTSGCLFTWKEDREQILKGPFTFRIREEPPTDIGAFDKVPAYWTKFIKNYYAQKKRCQHYYYFSLLFVLVVAVLWYYFITSRNKPY